MPSLCRSIHKYASCSAECFILALVYIDRLIQGNNLTLTSLNVHRVIITSVMLGAKFFDDQYFNNAYYAKVGGVPCPEMNSLELEFLFSINFSLHVSGEVYNRYRGELAAHMASMMPGPQAAHLHEVMVSARAAAEPAVLAPPMVLTATPGVPAAPVYVPGSGAHPVASAAAAVASGAGHASSSTSQPATAAFAQGHGWAPPAAEDDDDVEMGGGAAPAEATGWAPATAFGGSSSGAQ